MRKNHDFWLVIMAALGIVIFGLGLYLGAKVERQAQTMAMEARR